MTNRHSSLRSCLSTLAGVPWLLLRHILRQDLSGHLLHVHVLMHATSHAPPARAAFFPFLMRHAQGRFILVGLGRALAAFLVRSSGRTVADTQGC